MAFMLFKFSFFSWIKENVIFIIFFSLTFTLSCTTKLFPSLSSQVLEGSSVRSVMIITS